MQKRLKMEGDDLLLFLEQVLKDVDGISEETYNRLVEGLYWDNGAPATISDLEVAIGGLIDAVDGRFYFRSYFTEGYKDS